MKFRRKPRLRSGLFLLATLAMGCVFFKRPVVPMKQVAFISEEQRAKHLVLFLPGLGDSPESVVEGGLIEEMRAASQFDSIIADAHYGYYRTGTLTERLHEDIVGKVRSDYDEFWIVGTSMGGYGAISYAEKFPGSVTGIVLLAPYLGEEEVLADIERAGSLAQWHPERFQTDSKRTAHGVRIWGWLKQRPNHVGDPFVYLGTGDRDKLLRGARLLIPVLRPERVRIISGAHNWKTWRRLFHPIATDILATR